MGLWALVMMNDPPESSYIQDDLHACKDLVYRTNVMSHPHNVVLGKSCYKKTKKWTHIFPLLKTLPPASAEDDTANHDDDDDDVDDNEDDSGGLGRYSGSGMLDAIGRQLFSSGFKKAISSGVNSAPAHKVADAVLNGAASTSQKVGKALVKGATSAGQEAVESVVKGRQRGRITPFSYSRYRIPVKNLNEHKKKTH